MSDDRSKRPTGDYEVGYGRPPKHTRFQKGQSGNPKGRPKGAKNLKTDLEEELQESITVTVEGKQRRISKQRALIKSFVAKALKGEIRASTTLFNLILKTVEPAREADVDAPLTEEEEAALALLIERAQFMIAPQTDGRASDQAPGAAGDETFPSKENGNDDF